MPQKRMTLREQREAKRRIRELKDRVEKFERIFRVPEYSGTEIARGTVCDVALGAIRAAKELGYLTIVIENGGKMIARAVKLPA